MASFDGIDRSAEIPFDNVQVQEHVTNNVLNTFLLKQRTQWDTSNIVSGETLTATNVQGPGVFRNDQIPWSLAPGDVITSLVVPYISSGEVRVPGSNIYGPISDTTATLDVSHLTGGVIDSSHLPTTLDVSHLTGGLIDLSHLPSTLESSAIELAPNVKISTAYTNTYYFQSIGGTIPITDPTFNDVQLPQTHTTEGSPNMPHTLYSGVTVCASNVAYSALRDDVMPEYLRGTTTLESITVEPPIASKYRVIDRNPPLYTDQSAIVYTSNYFHLLPRVQVYGSNLAGFNVVTKQEDFKAGGSHRTIDNFTCDPGNENIILTHSLITDNVRVLPLAETQHNVFSTVSVLACNVIGGQFNHFLEDALPTFLTPVKTMTIEPYNKYTSWYGNPVDHGFTTTEYASNIHYTLPLVEIKSENVHGDNLTVNSNITTSNFNVERMVATTVKVQTNVQIINGAVSGSYLNMTSAGASNVIAGYMYITGVTTVGEYPSNFREFKCGSMDPSNTYAAEGDPECGYFGGFDDVPFYVSNNKASFLLPNTVQVNPDQRFKAISRFHPSQEFDDARHDYTYGNANGQKVYPPTGYHYSLKTVGTIWSGNKLLLSSDRRIKTDIEPLNSNACLLGVQCLKPCAYTALVDNRTEMGFIAQEVREYLPTAVSVCEGELVGGSNVPDFHTLNYNTLTTISVGAIQALANEIIDLKTRLKAIEDGVSRGGNTAI